MRIILCLLLLLTPVWAKAQSTAFDDAMAGLDKVFEDGGDPDRIYQYLTQTVRTSRALGRNEPDFAIFYAMLADHLRNVELNPVYALQVAEEGLELIAGDPAQSDFATILQVTRSYALADLGRLDEAYRQAQLILPTYGALFNQDTVADYARDAENWGQGQLSDFNTAATDLARDTLDRAYEHFETGGYGRVLTLASTALLPMGTGLAEADVRAINAEAEILMAQALGFLGRHGQAGNAWLRALGYLTQTPWMLDAEPDWWGAGPEDDQNRSVVFDIFEGLAGTAALMGLADIERAALREASNFATSPRDKYSVLVRRARLAMSNKNVDEGLALLHQSRDVAVAAGQDLDLRVADFYIALVEARQVEADTGVLPSEGIVAATEAALAAYRANRIDEEDFLYHNAAQMLIRSDDIATTLDYARQALAVRRARLEARNDTGFGQVQARRDARAVVELFLYAAHTGASEGLDPALAAPNCEDPRGFIGCTVTTR